MPYVFAVIREFAVTTKANRKGDKERKGNSGILPSFPLAWRALFCGWRSFGPGTVNRLPKTGNFLHLH
jgi:hypothetical protein